MKINVGCRERGIEFAPIRKTHVDLLQHYLDNVADKYEGDFVEKNKKFAKDILNKKNLVKYGSLVGTTFLGVMTLIGLMSGDPTYASTGAIIDTGPLDRFFNTVYWTMFRVLMYISTPVWAWVGYILATGGSNSEKRTQAKRVATGLIIGTGITASAPYLTRQLFNLWKLFT
jgi:hypothetical protein